jgi:hypothetical protein
MWQGYKVLLNCFNKLGRALLKDGVPYASRTRIAVVKIERIGIIRFHFAA